MNKLRDIFKLQGSTTLRERTKFAWLIYNLTSAANASRKLLFNKFLETINAKYGSLPLPLPNYSDNYKENTQPLSLIFVLGFS